MFRHRYGLVGFVLTASIVFFQVATAAVPTLKSKPERIEAIALAVKVPMGMRPAAIPMPKALHYRFRDGDRQWDETHYRVRDMWMSLAHGGLWRDAKGNEFRVARVNGSLPGGEAGAHAKREDLDTILRSAAMDDPKSDEVRIGDERRWADGVAVNVVYIASLIPGILQLSHEEFYDGDLKTVNDRYRAAWAVTYFLEKGAPVLDEFAAYRKVLPTYLSLLREGRLPTEASMEAWATIGKRDVVADFLRFWGKRVAAKSYEPK